VVAAAAQPQTNQHSTPWATVGPMATNASMATAAPHATRRSLGTRSLPREETLKAAPPGTKTGSPDGSGQQMLGVLLTTLGSTNTFKLK
jgi:hypothetical protein